MYEMSNFAEPDDLEIETRSPSVSFPDHYLVPYIEMCKRSKPITCVFSIFLICLATYFFFATNYQILFDYPITESRKIACVFAGVIFLVAATRCLELRFRIVQECRGERDDNVLFEMARQDTEFSNSFSGHFEMQEILCHGTPNEGTSQTDIPDDSISRAHTIDDPCVADISTSRYNGRAHLPRHSISDGMAPNTPLLPQERTLEISRTSWMKPWMDSKRLQNGGTVSDNNKYPPNYSTFHNDCGVSDTEPLLAESMFDNGCEASDTEPLLAKPKFRNGCEALETKPLLAESMFDNGCEASDTEPLLAKAMFRNGCEAPQTEPLLAESMYENGCQAYETKP